MTSRDVATHPVTEERKGPGVLGKMKEALGLSPSETQAGVSERAEYREKEHVEASKERVAGPGTPSRTGPVCAPSQVWREGRYSIRGKFPGAPAARCQRVSLPLEAGAASAP